MEFKREAWNLKEKHGIQPFFQHRLSLRRHFFSADSACVDIFLTQAQPTQANFQRRLSLRKKNKMANNCRGLRKKFFFSPVRKSPTHIGFIDVKKNGSKISHLGTFKRPLQPVLHKSCPTLQIHYKSVFPWIPYRLHPSVLARKENIFFTHTQSITYTA